VQLSDTCDTSSFAIYGQDRSIDSTDLRHIRSAYSTDGTSWTCYVQSDDAPQGGTPSFASASTNCGEGPSHAKSGSVFNHQRSGQVRVVCLLGPHRHLRGLSRVLQR
jgi:hypothetical protein